MQDWHNTQPMLPLSWTVLLRWWYGGNTISNLDWSSNQRYSSITFSGISMNSFSLLLVIQSHHTYYWSISAVEAQLRVYRNLSGRSGYYWRLWGIGWSILISSCGLAHFLSANRFSRFLWIMVGELWWTRSWRYCI